MSTAGFEPAIPEIERQQTQNALDCAASDVSGNNVPSIIVQAEQTSIPLNPF
jgi:hypothetical protein